MYMPIVMVNIDEYNFAAFQRGDKVKCRLGGSNYYQVQIRVPSDWVENDRLSGKYTVQKKRERPRNRAGSRF